MKLTLTTSIFSVFALSLFGLMAGIGSEAGAQEIFKPKREAPDQTRCKAMGEGFYAISGSTTCVKISGYIGAGVAFAAPGRVSAPSSGPFAARAGSFVEKETGVSVDARFNTEMGPARVYVEVGHRSLNR